MQKQQLVQILMMATWQVAFSVLAASEETSVEDIYSVRVSHGRYVSLADDSANYVIVLAAEDKEKITFQLGSKNSKFRYDTFKCALGLSYVVLAGDPPSGGVPSFVNTCALKENFFSLDYFACFKSGANINKFPQEATDYAVISCGGGLADRLFFHVRGIVRPGFCPVASIRGGKYAVLALRFLDDHEKDGPTWTVVGIRELLHREDLITGYTETTTVANWEDLKSADYSPKEIEAMCLWLRASRNDKKGLIIGINNELVSNMTRIFVEAGRNDCDGK